MNSNVTPDDEYRQQIARYSRALALGKTDKLGSEIVQFKMEPMNIFTAANRRKRRLKLIDQLELLEETFDCINELVATYMDRVPLTAYDNVCTDSQRFLEQLTQTSELSAEQKDCVSAQLGRLAVEAIARKNRVGHTRFQDLLSLSDQFCPQLESNQNLRVYLNPTRVWSTLETTMLLDEIADLPATVLYFASGDEITTAIFEPAVVSLFRKLESLSPCTLDELVSHTFDFDRVELTTICTDAVKIGVIALG